jgi:hypothetical protein
MFCPGTTKHLLNNHHHPAERNDWDNQADK